MLTQQEIERALKASRVAPLMPAADGPLGLDQLAEAVARSVQGRASASAQALIERPIALPVQTWEKLDEIARRSTQGATHPTSVSAVAAALLEQCVTGK